MSVLDTAKHNECKDDDRLPGVLIIFAKLSDIFGRKPFLLISLFTFLAFSAACGAAQTMPQL